MSGNSQTSLLSDPQHALRLLHTELADTNREVLALTLEMDQRLAQRAAELRATQEELQRTNSELLQLTLELEERVAQRTAELTKANEALRESEARFRVLVEAAPEAIFVQSGGRFVYLNPAMLRLLGASRLEDMLGTELMERIAPEYQEAVRGRIRLQRETGKPAPLMDQEYLRLDGSRVPVETTAVPVRFQGLDAHLVFVRDITERKQAEAETATLQEQFRQAQKMEAIGQLAGGVAHDFNNLLFVINGRIELLLARLAPDDPARKELEVVYKAGQRAVNLVRQLLAFSRRQVLQPKVLDLNAVLADMDKLLRRLIREDIAFTTVLDPALKPTKADPGQIEQVLMNLVVNARDAMPDGGKLTIETANVELDASYCRTHAGVEPGPYVMLAVSDTGCGMDENTKARLFEPFFTTKEVGKGTGLGLATVYGIVRQSGGNIGVYSEPGKGTSFKVYLPRVQETPSRASRLIAPMVLRGTETILLVEDDEQVRALAHEILESNGYTVLPAANGHEALSTCRDYGKPVHMLLSDMVMPGMGGTEVAARVRVLYPNVKVLFMSGYADNAVAATGMLESGAHFVQKPLAPSALARKVREVLDG
ncbi:MAG: PAS domain S-box protein [Planctomycetota bacterium]|nr:PAS domain S-box protein [Planctomycetota bacterium]